MAAWRSPLSGLDSAFAGPYVPTVEDDDTDVGQIVRKWLGGQGPSPSEQVSPTSMPLLDE